MTNASKINLLEYNNSGSVEYIKSDYHVVRIKIASDFIAEEVSKAPGEKRKGIKLLSLGCANGVVEDKIISEIGINVYGLDSSEEYSKEAFK